MSLLQQVAPHNINMDASQLQQALGRGGPQQPKGADPLAGDKKNNVLTQILDQGARARLNNIGAVDPNKLARVEGVLIQLAQQGKITQKLNEDSLKDILNQISGQGGSSGPKVKYNRRSVFDSDEDDDDDNY